jgi:Fic family protein
MKRKILNLRFTSTVLCLYFVNNQNSTMAKLRIEKAPSFNFDSEFSAIHPYITKYSDTDEQGRYLHWSQFKWRVDKGDDVELAWKTVLFKRGLNLKHTGLQDPGGISFTYNIPASMESKLYHLDKLAGGNVGSIEESAASDSLQNRFLVSSLIMEEAITSAQLEGASTTREVAKKMLEEEREPIDEDERMILNNFLLLKHAERKAGEPLTIDLILEFHYFATFKTSENNVVPGSFREANDIYIEDGDGNIAHRPPDFKLIEDRLRSLCAFANIDHTSESGSSFMHPILKAIILHFFIGYEHAFRDGNGRTARALFYWFMLKSDYKLFKYVSISKLLRENPRDYGESFLYTERGHNDLTYFIYYQLDIIIQAFNDLKSYLENKVSDFQKITALLEQTKWGKRLNFVQIDLIKKAVKEL